ncbi:hypothetical protein [Deinococcus sp.]|uniref:hypothetical protein n=1 Tax=Deinococcus sp. TaxID=47478 RepID=UPI003CC54259
MSVYDVQPSQEHNIWPWEGTWNVSVSTPLGTQTVQYEFRPSTDPSPVPLGVARQGAELTELSDLAWDAPQLTWTQRVTRPMKLTLTFTVTFSGDAISGTAKAGVLPASKVSGSRLA